MRSLSDLYPDLDAVVSDNPVVSETVLNLNIGESLSTTTERYQGRNEAGGIWSISPVAVLDETFDLLKVQNRDFSGNESGFFSPKTPLKHEEGFEMTMGRQPQADLMEALAQDEGLTALFPPTHHFDLRYLTSGGRERYVAAALSVKKEIKFSLFEVIRTELDDKSEEFYEAFIRMLGTPDFSIRYGITRDEAVQILRQPRLIAQMEGLLRIVKKLAEQGLFLDLTNDNLICDKNCANITYWDSFAPGTNQSVLEFSHRRDWASGTTGQMPAVYALEAFVAHLKSED